MNKVTTAHKWLLPILCVAFTLIQLSFVSAEVSVKLPKIKLDNSVPAIERGAQSFKAVCANCHSMSTLKITASLSPESIKKKMGAVAPDLSLITKARGRGDEGAVYVYAFLTGYEKNMQKNKYFPNVAMPNPGVDDQMAQDIAVFLNYTADPYAAQRKSIGKFVIAFNALVAALLYLNYRETWLGIEKDRNH